MICLPNPTKKDLEKEIEALKAEKLNMENELKLAQGSQESETVPDWKKGLKGVSSKNMKILESLMDLGILEFKELSEKYGKTLVFNGFTSDKLKEDFESMTGKSWVKGRALCMKN